MPRLKLIHRIAAPAAFAALAAAGISAAPAPAQPQMVDAKTERRTDYGPGRSDSMTDAERTQWRKDIALIDSFDGDIVTHEDELAERGIVIVSDTFALENTATNNDMINMKDPFVYYNTQQGRYFATASYQWRLSADYEYFDSPCGSADSPCNVGGADGFGMRFNRQVTNDGVSGTFCGRQDLDRDWANFGCIYPTNPEDNSSAGVSYRRQDKVYTTVIKPDNNMYSGTVSMGFHGVPCGATLQIYGRYGHSWGGTALTGFSVGTGGFGLSWSDSDQHWAATSQAGSWTRNC